MDKDMDQEIFSVFGQLCEAADNGRISHSAVDIQDADPLRRALIASMVGSLLNERYPESTIVTELVETRTMAVSMTR
ncbi:hypothetical protein [Pseudomonas sp. NA-150]|uniref:hypothetical protein n=1 Tax=Pseudomonas sp. NA-150 TaxID=3367525 RepID=UPI0037C51D9F